jgi:hypothetical protein
MFIVPVDAVEIPLKYPPVVVAPETESEYTLFAVIFAAVAAVTFIPTNGVIVPVAAFDKLVERILYFH